MLAIAVMVGIWLYRHMKERPKSGTASTNDRFEGPDIDNKTGAYLPADAQPGTVEFSAQGN